MSIDELIETVAEILENNFDLVLGFNTFLPLSKINDEVCVMFNNYLFIN